MGRVAGSINVGRSMIIDSCVCMCVYKGETFQYP